MNIMLISKPEYLLAYQFIMGDAKHMHNYKCYY